MSWDIYIQDFPSMVEKVADIPEAFQPKSLGKRSDLIAQIRDVVPSADFSEPAWGVFDGDGYSIEFSMGSSEICNGVTLLVRGGGSVALLIAALLDRMKLRGIDCQTCEFFDIEAARASFGSWQQYRDEIIGLKPRDDDGAKD